MTLKTILKKGTHVQGMNVVIVSRSMQAGCHVDSIISWHLVALADVTSSQDAALVIVHRSTVANLKHVDASQASNRLEVLSSLIRTS